MRRGLVFALAIVISSGTAWGSDDQLEGANLRKAVAGKTVNLQTPLGGLPISFRIDGTMHAKTAELAHYTGSTQDRGIWWVAADKLCQRWNTWMSGKSYCFTLRRQGRVVQWTRNDGLTGVATIRR